MKINRLSNIKAFIFDLDGTLLDSMPVWDRVYAAPFRRYGIPVPEGYLLKVNHMSLSDCMKYTLLNTPLTCDGETLLNIWNRNAENAYLKEIELKDGAKELLELLHLKGVKLAVATALPYYLFLPCLKRLGVYPLFDVFVSTDDVSKGKDSPEVYLRAAEKMGLAPKDCAVAEDSHVGIVSAKDAGFITVGVYDKASERFNDVIRKAADVYVDNLSQITDALKKRS